MALKKAGFIRGRRLPFRKKEAEHKINHFINSPEVRLLGENIASGIYPLEKR